MHGERPLTVAKGRSSYAAAHWSGWGFVQIDAPTGSAYAKPFHAPVPLLVVPWRPITAEVMLAWVGGTLVLQHLERPIRSAQWATISASLSYAAPSVRWAQANQPSVRGLEAACAEVELLKFVVEIDVKPLASSCLCVLGCELHDTRADSPPLE